MEDDREQFNNYISKRVKKDFKDIVNRKYGYYAKNMWSYEAEQAYKYYISVGGILPTTTRAHAFSPENDLPTSPSIMVKNGANKKLEVVLSIAKNYGIEVDYNSEKFKEWYKCCKTDPEFLAQQKKQTNDRLKARIAGHSHKNVETKLGRRLKRAIGIRREIMQYLIKVDKINNDNQVKKLNLDDAIKVVMEVGDSRAIEKCISDLEFDGQLKTISRDTYQLMEVNN